jgi:hypothetical protein
VVGVLVFAPRPPPAPTRRVDAQIGLAGPDQLRDIVERNVMLMRPKSASRFDAFALIGDDRTIGMVRIAVCAGSAVLTPDTDVLVRVSFVEAAGPDPATVFEIGDFGADALEQGFHVDDMGSLVKRNRAVRTELWGDLHWVTSLHMFA